MVHMDWWAILTHPFGAVLRLYNSAASRQRGQCDNAQPHHKPKDKSHPSSAAPTLPPSLPACHAIHIAGSGRHVLPFLWLPFFQGSALSNCATRPQVGSLNLRADFDSANLRHAQIDKRSSQVASVGLYCDGFWLLAVERLL